MNSKMFWNGVAGFLSAALVFAIIWMVVYGTYSAGFSDGMDCAKYAIRC